jgi:hypothetical protein
MVNNNKQHLLLHLAKQKLAPTTIENPLRQEQRLRQHLQLRRHRQLLLLLLLLL